MDQAKHIQVIIGILYATAILAACIRTAIRLCLQRRLLIDDGFLIVACVALTVSTIDIYKGLLYILEAQEFADARVSNDFSELAGLDVVAGVLWYQRVTYIYTTMVWIVVFAVKLAFLSYFRHLVSRVRNFIVYWKAVAGINVVAFLFCVYAEFMECPYTSLKTCESVPTMCTKRGLYSLCVLVTCGQGSGLYRAAGFSRTAISLDVITDHLSPGHQSSSNAQSLIANSHQYPGTSSLAGENQTPPENRNRRVPLPQHLHDRHRLHQNFWLQGLWLGWLYMAGFLDGM